ncbi:MAG: 4Fe-4S dicluster domain-containing protein [Pseudomonadota bacterium]
MAEDSEKSVIDSGDLDAGFVRGVAARKGGEGIRTCYSCGTCTASCPVRAADPAFDPRKVLRMILLGMRDEVYKSEFMWMCAGCQACTDRCPQGVAVSDIMVILRNMAVEQGIMHRSYVLQIGELKKYGRLYEVTPYNKKRDKLSLPPLKDDLDPIVKILAGAGLDDPEGGGEK